MKIKLKYIAILLLLIVFTALATCGFNAYKRMLISNQVAKSGIYKTDSIYTNRQYHLKVIPVPVKPVKVLVYNKPDTVLRHQVEKDTIITGITIQKGILSVEKIDARGIVHIDSYPIDLSNIRRIDIGNTGKVGITNKPVFFQWLRKEAKWVIPVGCVLAGGVATYFLINK